MVGWKFFSGIIFLIAQYLVRNRVVVALSYWGRYALLFSALGIGRALAAFDDTVFPRYVANTLGLMAGVAFLSLFFGISTARVAQKNFQVQTFSNAPILLLPSRPIIALPTQTFWNSRSRSSCFEGYFRLAVCEGLLVSGNKIYGWTL